MKPSAAIPAELPLVFLPGTLCDARVFSPWRAAMAAATVGRPAIMADMGGLPSARALAERVLATVPGRFVAVGFSLGAIVALEIAAIAPGRLAGMVLANANARPVPLVDWPARRAISLREPGHVVGELLWPRSVHPRRRDDAALHATIVAMARSQPADTLPLQTEVALTRSDKRPLLVGMAMPALVLGGEDDAIAPPELQVELAAGLPAATLAIAPGAGHFLPLECPEFCALATSGWLAPAETVA